MSHVVPQMIHLQSQAVNQQLLVLYAPIILL